MTAAIPLCIVPAKAQFNTVATIPARYKVEVLRTDMKRGGYARKRGSRAGCIDGHPCIR